MEKILKIKSLKRALTLALGLCALYAPAYAEEVESKPLPHIETDCIFTYHFDYRDGLGRHIFRKLYCFANKEVDNQQYKALIECDENGNYAEDAKVVAYLREEDNKIYMLLGDAEVVHWSGYVYGLTNRETMIYDYSLEPGESYRIGEMSDYVIMNDNDEEYMRGMEHWISENEIYSPFTYLCTWNYGELTLREKRFDQEMKRMVWTVAQKFFDPTLTNYGFVNPWDSEGWRTFDITDGFGCMQSLMPFPGLFPPCINMRACYFTGENPILCKVERLGTKEVLFERTDLTLDNVEQLDADMNQAPRYYNLQGVELQEPAEGICIVRRGNRATKELIRR